VVVVVGGVKELIEPETVLGRRTEAGRLLRKGELDWPEDECFRRLGERKSDASLDDVPWVSLLLC
jgi:hypothetical protein